MKLTILLCVLGRVTWYMLFYSFLTEWIFWCGLLSNHLFGFLAVYFVWLMLVPAGWEFCITQSHPDYKSLFDVFKISCVMGYPLLVNEYKHYIGIIERDPVEVLRFMEIELF
ncbi:hypothetical protein C4J85_2916 [Pseudomonas sp. R4-34-07]|uniref:hypothetical protein n=1 Tax=Pseudomonas sp. R4-34-07 TaxID=658642 RepID=UPI000F589E4A|nr:hypothetical protein [Pseudomonas sp. R4-34-07]AZF53400.1 hypothetical protein C4J85_2916 [Pseudomonas sp. R4-34-07]